MSVLITRKLGDWEVLCSERSTFPQVTFCSYSRNFPSDFLSHGSLPPRSCFAPAPRALTLRAHLRCGQPALQPSAVLFFRSEIPHHHGSLWTFTTVRISRRSYYYYYPKIGIPIISECRTRKIAYCLFFKINSAIIINAAKHVDMRLRSIYKVAFWILCKNMTLEISDTIMNDVI